MTLTNVLLVLALIYFVSALISDIGLNWIWEGDPEFETAELSRAAKFIIWCPLLNSFMAIFLLTAFLIILILDFISLIFERK